MTDYMERTFMEKLVEILKKFKPVDFIIVGGVIVALLVGFFTYKNFRQTAAKQIEATSKISFQVFVRGVTLTGNEIPMKTNDKTFISIRNVPYTDLDIVDVKADRKKIVLPILNSKKVMIVEDVSQANMYDITVTLTDTAKITKDGAVVGGNKIKMGLPITLEGKNYKFNGTVSDLKVMPETNDDKFHNSINTDDDVQ